MDAKQNIIATAEKLFLMYGFKSITMDEIARNAGISKKTLYEHFDDKEELVEILTTKIFTTLHNESIQITSNSKNAVEELTLILGRLSSLIDNMNPVCFMDLQRYYPKAYQHFLQHKEESILPCIKANLIRGIKEGLYRENQNVEIIANFRIESSLLPFYSHLFPKNKNELLTINLQLFEHYIYGITSIKGHKLFNNYLSKLSKKKNS